MFDLFVLQNTAQRRVRDQFEPKPDTRRARQAHEPEQQKTRRTARLTALRPFRAAADR
jgi:hypothetical protein